MDKLGVMKMASEQPMKGLLSSILDGTPLKSLGITPQILQRDLVIELTTQQLRDIILQNADERAKQSVSLELHEGKLVLKIRLF